MHLAFTSLSGYLKMFFMYDRSFFTGVVVVDVVVVEVVVVVDLVLVVLDVVVFGMTLFVVEVVKGSLLESKLDS